MDHFETFDSLEELQEAMARNSAAALAQLHPVQQAMTPPCWFVSNQSVAIFGECPTFEELDAIERRLGATDREARQTDRAVRHAFEGGLLFGRCYSLASPSGEWGSTHKISVWPITRAQFEEAREFNWDPAAIADAFGPGHWLFHLGPTDA